MFNCWKQRKPTFMISRTMNNFNNTNILFISLDFPQSEITESIITFRKSVTAMLYKL